MKPGSRQTFQLVWLLVIFLCLAAAVFTLFFTSCTSGSVDETTKVPAADDEIVITVPSPSSSTAPTQTPDEPTPAQQDTTEPTPAG